MAACHCRPAVLGPNRCHSPQSVPHITHSGRFLARQRLHGARDAIAHDTVRGNLAHEIEGLYPRSATTGACEFAAWEPGERRCGLGVPQIRGAAADSSVVVTGTGGYGGLANGGCASAEVTVDLCIGMIDRGRPTGAARKRAFPA